MTEKSSITGQWRNYIDMYLSLACVSYSVFTVFTDTAQ
jgi:hypothetical protein